MPADVGLPRNQSAAPVNAGEAVIIGIQDAAPPPLTITSPWAVSGSALMTCMLTRAPALTVMAGSTMPAMRNVSSGPPAGLATTVMRAGVPGKAIWRAGRVPGAAGG